MQRLCGHKHRSIYILDTYHSKLEVASNFLQKLQHLKFWLSLYKKVLTYMMSHRKYQYIVPSSYIYIKPVPYIFVVKHKMI
jgi:hypothetical protein